MKTHQIALVLVAATGLAGCDLIKAATADKPNSRQRDAIGDIFSQVGTLASMADDPSSVSSYDLAQAMSFGAFVHLIRPDTAPNAPSPAIWAFLDGPPPGCIVAGDDGLTFDCDVTLIDGSNRECNVAGTLGHAGGTKYLGALTMSGAGCPEASADLDIDYVEEPLLASGTFTYSYKDSMFGDDFSGAAEFNEISFANGCDLPSKGNLSASADGTYHDEEVHDGITVSFNADPCGIVYIE